ncbi:MAG TPA: hypothetical protein VF785_11475 [Gemmatimonadaceae bacterium]
MKASTAQRLVRLYPLRWQLRYGDEFAALLEDHALSFATVVDVVVAACAAYFRVFDIHLSSPRTRGVVLWTAWMMALAGGVSLFETVDDSELARMTQQQPWPHFAWVGLEIGAAIAGAAIALSTAVVLWSMLLEAGSSRRGEIFARLVVPACMGLLLVGWVGAVLFATRGRWGASPWAVAVQRPDFPSTVVRWLTGFVTMLLAVSTEIVGTMRVASALRDSSLQVVRLRVGRFGIAMDPLRIGTATIPVLASGTLVMFACVVAWGFSAGIRTAAFDARTGAMGLTALTSWLMSVILIGVPAALMIQVSLHTTDTPRLS